VRVREVAAPGERAPVERDRRIGIADLDRDRPVVMDDRARATAHPASGTELERDEIAHEEQRSVRV
jgi:hypothetical protein